MGFSTRVFPPITAMIVDDQQDVAQLYSMYLASLEVDSIIFANPLLALDHYQQNHGRYVSCIFRFDSTRFQWPGTCKEDKENQFQGSYFYDYWIPS